MIINPRENPTYHRELKLHVYTQLYGPILDLGEEDHDSLMNYYKANTSIITNWVMIINPKNLSECDERNNKERLVRNS